MKHWRGYAPVESVVQRFSYPEWPSQGAIKSRRPLPETDGGAAMPAMFRQILVPVDLTDRHSAAVEIVGRLAKESDAEVVILHVIELVQGLPREEDPPFYRRLEVKAKENVSRLVEALREKKVKVRSEIVFGNRVAEITSFARQNGTDLIVLASHRIDPARPGAGWGSLSHQVGVLATCPVLLVK
jgi:nucleotide-binding universal stress UspA family protein